MQPDARRTIEAARDALLDNCPNFSMITGPCGNCSGCKSAAALDALLTEGPTREQVLAVVRDGWHRWAGPEASAQEHLTDAVMKLYTLPTREAREPEGDRQQTFDAIMATIPQPSCVHGVANFRDEACPECVASPESDPLFVLDFCEGAILDAILCDEGLDGGTGQGVLAMIRNAKARAAAPREPDAGAATTEAAR